MWKHLLYWKTSHQIVLFPMKSHCTSAERQLISLKNLSKKKSFKHIKQCIKQQKNLIFVSLFHCILHLLYYYVIVNFFFCLFSGATPAAHGDSQARGRIGVVATGLHHSHSSAGSEPRLWSTPQLMAMPDPWPTEQGQGWNPQPHGS